MRLEWRIKQSAGSTSGGTRTSGARAARSTQEAGRPKAETSWPKMEGRRARPQQGLFLLPLNQLEWISPSYNPRAQGRVGSGEGWGTEESFQVQAGCAEAGRLTAAGR